MSVNIDRGTFLLLVGTLAVGGASGYVAAEKRVLPSVDKWRGRPPEIVMAPVAEPPRTPVDADAAPAVSAPPAPTAPVVAAPACDDSVATVGACPPPGLPTDEGGCGSFANLRCTELKQAMKPKVASAAVSCLNGLKASERCDAARVYLCGHLAFMNACAEGDSAHSVAAHDGGATGTSATSGTSGIASPGGKTDGGTLASNVGALCQSIIAGCGASPVAPSMAECRQLLSGMTEVGRERTRTCMKAHCFDRGLVGCEGVVVAN